MILQVYSPFLRAWIPHFTRHPDPLESAADVQPNPKSIHDHKSFGQLFNTQVPNHVVGFELAKDDAQTLHTCWPAGEEAAHAMLRRFLYTKGRSSQFGAVDPLAPGEHDSKNPTKDSRVGKYKDARDKVNIDSTSRLRWVLLIAM